MLKVYRLLRNNREMGPYTLEELLQTNLHSLDLIWVEGKSSCWAYPYEIEALKGHVAPPPRPSQTQSPEAARPREQDRRQEQTVEARHIFVSMPPPKAVPAANTDMQPHRYPAAQHQTSFPVNDPAEGVRTAYSRSLDEAEETYTRWLVEKKRKKKGSIGKYALVVVLGAAVITGAVFAVQRLQRQAAPVATEKEAPPQTIPAASWVSGQDEADSAAALVNLPIDTQQVVATIPATNPAAKAKPRSGKPAASNSGAPADTTVAMVPEPLPQQEEAQQVAAEPEPETTTVPAPEKKKKGFLSGLLKAQKRNGLEIKTKRTKIGD